MEEDVETLFQVNEIKTGNNIIDLDAGGSSKSMKIEDGAGRMDEERT